jgi:nucleoside-diphosphate-sugar epimerase
VTDPTESAEAPPTVAITGATGYIGGLAARRYAEAGWRVVSLRRTPSPSAGRLAERPFVLGEPLDPANLDGVRVLIHCAWDLALTDERDIQRVNVFGTRRLLDAAAAAGVERIVFVSSMSAYEGTGQIYGRAKLECEQVVLDGGGVVVRLGLVYGDGWGGMAGSLRRLLGLPLVPLMGGDSYQFTAHEADVAEGLFVLGTTDVPPKAPIGLAHPGPVPFRQVLEGFARQAGIRPRLIPVPWRPVYAAMRAGERVGAPLPLRADSLLGLVRPAPSVPGVDEWRRLGVPIRPFGL